MQILCCECGEELKEGDEVEGLFKAYYKALASKVHYAVSEPHDFIAETMAHVKCPGGPI